MYSQFFIEADNCLGSKLKVKQAWMHLRWGPLQLEPAQRLLFPSPSHPCHGNCHTKRSFKLIMCSVVFYNLDCRPRALDTRRSKLWPSFPTSCVIVRNHPSFVGSSLASSVSWSRKKSGSSFHCTTLKDHHLHHDHCYPHFFARIIITITRSSSSSLTSLPTKFTEPMVKNAW